MARMYRALLGGALVVAVFAGAAFGAVMVTGTAEAQEPVNAGTITAPPVRGGDPAPTGADPCLTLNGVTLCAPGQSGGGSNAGASPDVIVCSIVDGCDVPIAFVGEDGEVVKVLTIRLTDPEPEDGAETTP